MVTVRPILVLLGLLAACSTSPEVRPPVVSSCSLYGYGLARFDVRGCFTEELVAEEVARPKVNIIFGAPIQSDGQLAREGRELRRRILGRTGGDVTWRQPAALELDPEHREILVRQRFELLPEVERAISEVRRDRQR